MTNVQDSDSARDPDRVAGSELGIIDILIILAKHKFLILGLPFVVSLVAAAISLTLPFIYTATTRIFLPPQGQAGMSAIVAQLGGLTGGGGVLRNQNDLYIGIFKSQTIADNLIQRFGLLQSYQAQYPSRVRQRLAAMTTISAGKDNIIAISVDDEDPRFAADLANAYVEEFSKLTNVLAFTDASRRRLFFERQFEQARDNLTKAEVSAREALQSGGLLQVEGQGRAIAEMSARLRAQITVKEVEIGSMRAFATDRNPELLQAQGQLSTLKRELARIEGGAGNNAERKGRESERGIASVRLLRNVKYHEAIYELLAKQYELAKIDEAKESSVIQVIDKASVPDFRTKPKRGVIVTLSALVALVAGILSAFVWEGIDNSRRDPRQAGRLRILKACLNWSPRSEVDR
jgi:tyrosine-protein kinase Etk/Wzc